MNDNFFDMAEKSGASFAKEFSNKEVEHDNFFDMAEKSGASFAKEFSNKEVEHDNMFDNITFFKLNSEENKQCKSNALPKYDKLPENTTINIV